MEVKNNASKKKIIYRIYIVIFLIDTVVLFLNKINDLIIIVKILYRNVK